MTLFTEPQSVAVTKTPVTLLEERTLVNLLMRGIQAIQAEQTKTGEIPSYRRMEDRTLSYARTLLISTFVDDALAEFDSRSRDLNTRLLDIIPRPYRHRFFSTVRQIRRGIRAFIAWQEEPIGTWRFFGRSSGIDPDACTIARAASVMLDQRGDSHSQPHWQKYVDSLARFRSDAGIYSTFLAPQGDGYGWLDAKGRRVIGYDVIVNALVVDYLALLGEIQDETVAYLRRTFQEGEACQGTVNFPNPVSACYVLTRVWRRARLPGLDEMGETLARQLLARQQSDGGFGGPLSTAMALSALMELGHEGEASAAARAALVRSALQLGGWPCEDFVINGYGSPAWTTALALNALVRCAENMP